MSKLFSILVAGALFSSGSLGARAQELSSGQLTIEHPWARATAASQRNGAAYLTIHNMGSASDRLVAAAAEVSERVELHNHEIDAQGVARMRQVTGGIELPPGEAVALQPGGLHVMLLGLGGPLEDGQSFPLRLHFEKAGEVTVEVAIAKSMPQPMHGGHGAAKTH